MAAFKNMLLDHGLSIIRVLEAGWSADRVLAKSLDVLKDRRLGNIQEYIGPNSCKWVLGAHPP